MRVLKIAVLLVIAIATTGCFKIEVVHRLHPYGATDTGAYRISMNAFTYGVTQGDGSYAKLLRGLRSFSTPSMRVDDNGDVHIEDVSMLASMEHAYDSYHCVNAPVAGYADCRFVAQFDFKDVPGWAVDWTVVVPPEMVVLSSGHQRMRTNGLERTLMWHFDATTDRSGTIDFTIRTPRVARQTGY